MRSRAEIGCSHQWRYPLRWISLFAAVLIFGAPLSAQPVAAGITTINQPASGQAVFDGSGFVYYLNNGPITPGAAQTQSGGGSCTVEVFPVGPVPEPCPDAQIVKVDPMGNIVYGTLLGGPTADSGSALAIDSAGDVFITGSTGGQFPTTSNAAIATSTTSATFAARLSADGSAFLYSTYLPVSAATATGIAVDAQDNAIRPRLDRLSAFGPPVSVSPIRHALSAV